MAYFANGTEGEVLGEQCGECRLPDDCPCPVLFVQMTYNYKQCDKKNKDLREAMNCLIDEDGNCQMKEQIDLIYGDSYFAGEEADTAQRMLDEL